jgi:hypothetical protein
MPRGVPQRLRPQDTLSVLQSGSAVGGAIEQGSVMIYYDDLPGIAARFIDTPTLMRRGVNIIGVKNTLALGVTGGYSGSQAINTTDDLFKANTDYALVGYLTDTLCGSIGWKGADTGNLRVGGPGHNTQKQVTGDWFKRLGEEFGLPMIPVFNSAGKGAIFIDGTQDDGGADPIVTSLFVELAPGQ